MEGPLPCYLGPPRDQYRPPTGVTTPRTMSQAEPPSNIPPQGVQPHGWRPVEDVLDLAALEQELGRRPSPSQIRAALPRGLVLDEDGLHVRTDRRILMRHSWVLVTSLIVFGGASLWLFQDTLPGGWKGVGRLLGLVAILALAGGLVGPMITRALLSRQQ